MTIESIMTRDVVTVEMDDSLSRIRSVFEREGFHHALVVDEGELVGVISDRDLLRALSPYLGTPSEMARDEQTLARRAHQIMSRFPVTVTGDTPVEAAAALLLEHGISCLPVVSPERRVEGIVTWRDLLRYYAEGG